MTSYYYNWVDANRVMGITDDPRWEPDALPHESHLVIKLNGERVHGVRRARSGGNGWIDICEKKNDGGYHIKESRQRGQVEIVEAEGITNEDLATGDAG